MISRPPQAMFLPRYTHKNSLLIPIYLAFSLLGLIIAYYVIPIDNLVLRSWLATLSALLLIWGYLFSHYNGKIPLKSNVFVMFAFSMSHLLPVCYLSVRIAKQPGLDLWGLAPVYPLVCVVTTLGALAFCIGYGFLERRLFHKSAIHGAKENRLEISPWVLIIPFLIILWAARGFLLYNGAYYWTYVNEDFVFGRWFSVAYRVSIYGLILPIYLWLLQYRYRRWLFLALLITTMEFAWVVPSGSRGVIASIVSALLIVYWWLNRRFPWKWVIVVSFAFVVTMPIIGVYRNVISSVTDTNRIAISSTVTAYRLAMDRLGGVFFDPARLLNDKLVFRMFDGQYLGYLLENYRQAFDWAYGSTYYERLPYILLPNFIYPYRPPMQVPLDNWFKLHARGSAPSTFLGEAYVNFGFLGVPVIAFIMGMVLAIFDFLFTRRQNNYFIIAIYLFFVNQMGQFVSQSMASWLCTLRDAALMVLLYYIFEQLFLRKSKFREREKSTGSL